MVVVTGKAYCALHASPIPVVYHDGGGNVVPGGGLQETRYRMDGPLRRGRLFLKSAGGYHVQHPALSRLRTELATW